MTYIATVIIPAHNEEKVIARCLRSVLDDEASGDLDIIVACNGCTDNTAKIAAEVSPAIRVVETEVASKWGALDLGDSVAQAFPRIYLDADVVLSPGAIRSVAEAMEREDKPSGSPTLRFPDDDFPTALSLYYSTWLQSPYFDHLIGFGFYALSEEGRSRFGAFPHTMAEDTLIKHLFTPEERCIDEKSWFLPALPRTLGECIRVNTRQIASNQELQGFAEQNNLGIGIPATNPSWLLSACRRPRGLRSVLVFISVRAYIEARARLRRRSDSRDEWTRDRSVHD